MRTRLVLFALPLAGLLYVRSHDPLDAAPGQVGALRVARIFADGSVVQHGVELPVWGWAAPGTSIAVALGAHTARTVATPAGKWRVVLPALPPGGPHELTVMSREARITVRDILAGDVWVASGQSNMEWPVVNAMDAPREIAAARDTWIRQFKVPHAWADDPQAELTGGTWTAADSAHVGDFTAVGYFFARELRAVRRIPIGVLNISWSGSAIEPWMSRSALRLDDSAWKAIAGRERAYAVAIRDSLERLLGTLPTVDSGRVSGRAVWADPTYVDSTWRTVMTPGRWERGYPGLDGVAWYRISFPLADTQAGQAAQLVLGPIDDNDITWVNGVEVGRTSGYSIPRRYTVPAGVLRAGQNTVTVRVEDGGGDGGVMGEAGQVFIDIGGTLLSLSGLWKFRAAVVSLQPNDQRINRIPTVLYNQMVHPILDFPIAGVIWYQGESNANSVAQALEYRSTFATLITSWRRAWRSTRSDFPFLWVQLANYGAVDSVPPSEAGWATLRASQTAALSLPATGQAVTIDGGPPADLHPRDKQVVGRRLALVARAVAYGDSVDATGPTYKAHEIRGGRMLIHFDHAIGGLVTRGGTAIGGFAIAGRDGRFVWANARIDSSRVEVWSDSVPEPVAARYAWSNSPSRLNLYNRAGLPAVPFRTDSW